MMPLIFLNDAHQAAICELVVTSLLCHSIPQLHSHLEPCQGGGCERGTDITMTFPRALGAGNAEERQ